MQAKYFRLFAAITLILTFVQIGFSQRTESATVVIRNSNVKVNQADSKYLLELERQAFELINNKRTASGLEKLTWNEDVARSARMHSRNMAESNFFSHQGLDGLWVDKRAEKFGIRSWREIGENIACNRGFSDPTEHAVEAWMKSTGHRDNILGKSWLETGIGVAVSDEGMYYFTQVFLLRK
jgi:uncharacterized protein YkwD